MQIKPIAFIENDFKEKFGIPRQSGLTKLSSRIVFNAEYSDENALRGLEDFTHIWLIWGFSEVSQNGFSPTVRPPRLGGNIRKGVFATRSPYRPNPLGLSVVKIESIERGIITVLGADLMNGTPIYDIKPYLPYSDSVPDAANGWALVEQEILRVEFPNELLEKIPIEKREGLCELLSQDPRPQYQNNPERVYTMAFGEMQISFRVEDERLVVTEIK